MNPNPPKVSRQLLKNGAIVVMALSAATVIWRISSGRSQEAIREVNQAAAERQKVVASGTPSQSNIQLLLDGQAKEGERERQERSMKEPSLQGPGIAAQVPPLTGKPVANPQTGGQVNDGAGNVTGGGSGQQADPKALARSSQIDAYENASAWSSVSGVPVSELGGQKKLQPLSDIDQLQEKLKQISTQTPARPVAAAPAATATPELLGQPSSLRTSTPISVGGQVNQTWLATQQAASLQEPPALKPVMRPTNDCMLHEGAGIPIAMIDEINSDLPGSWSALVYRDVYDSVNGKCLVIPAGTRLNGLYNSEVLIGQSRVLMAATRMKFTSGNTMRLTGMSVSDRAGASGAPADVNNHFWQIFGSSLFIGSVALAAAPSNTNSSVSINVGGSSGGTYGSVASQALSDTNRRILDRYQNVKPTLNVKRTEKLILRVSRDMVLPPEMTGGRMVY